jgi:hypothetical protein
MTEDQEIEFICPAEGCGKLVRFNLSLLEREIPEVLCPACGKTYLLSPEAIEKLGLLRDLIAALRKARPILGDGGVGIEVGGHKVVVPYFLLLTRMTSELALKIADDRLTFRFVVEA